MRVGKGQGAMSEQEKQERAMFEHNYREMGKEFHRFVRVGPSLTKHAPLDPFKVMQMTYMTPGLMEEDHANTLTKSGKALARNFIVSSILGVFLNLQVPKPYRSSRESPISYVGTLQ